MNDCKKFATTKQKISWEIKDFKLYSVTPNNLLTSPSFCTHYLDYVTWQLILYLKERENEIFIGFSISRIDHIFAVKEIDLSYQLYLADENRRPQFMKLKNCIINTETMYSAEDSFIKLSSLEEKHFQDQALVICCEMTLKIEQKSHFSALLDPHLVSLSEDILKLHREKLFSDVRIKNESSAFKVHKCILIARWWNVFNRYSMHERKKYVYIPLPSETLRNIIQYLYSRTGMNLSPRLQMDLKYAADSFEIKFLEETLKRNPLEAVFITKLRINCFHCPYGVCIFPVGEEILSGYAIDGTLEQFSFSADTHGHEVVSYRVTFISFGKGYATEGCLHVSSIEIDPVPANAYFLKNSSPQGESTLAQPAVKITVVLVKEDLKEYRDTKPLEESCFINHPLWFSDNMEWLFHADVYYDTKLRSLSDNRTWKLHKHILYVRSRFFRRYLKRKEMKQSKTLKLRLRDCDSDCLEVGLKYIYTGRIIVTLNVEVQKLIEVAKFLEIPLLEQELQSISDAGNKNRNV